MAEEHKQLILCEFTKQAPSFDRIEETLQEKGVQITPNDYLKVCKENGLTPDIHQTFVKIDEGVATLEEVSLLLCDIGSSVQERILRRVRKSPTEGHITHGGHQKLGGATMSGRVTPKRKRSGHTQKHGRGEHAHDRSTTKQRRHSGSVDESGPSGPGEQATTTDTTT